MDRMGYTPSAPGRAPAAGQPGMGRGNVPHAPGVISGNLGQQQNPQQLARATAPPRQVSMPGQAPAPEPPGQAPGPPGPAAGMGMMGPPNPAGMYTALYMQMFESWFNSLIEASNQPGNQSFGIY